MDDMNEKSLKLEYYAHISSKQARGWLSIPTKEPGQRVFSTVIAPNPNLTYRDKFENEIAYFESAGDLMNIKLKLELFLESYSFKDKKIKFPTKGRLFDLYTQSEPFLKQTSYIKKLAKKIIEKNGNNQLDALQEAFIFTTQNFKYKYPILERGTEHLDPGCLMGDCGEYTAFLVTLARCLGIPARPSTGFVLYPKTKKIMEHAWVSVYVSGFGWADLDAQYASLEKNSTQAIKKYFLARTDKRVVFTSGYNIPLQPTIPVTYDISFWNKAGLLLKRNSVQTLQPFVFSTKGVPRFQSSIKFS